MSVSVLTPPKLPRTPRQCDRVACILKTARQAFAERPFHEVLMDDVAKVAGVGKGTIYRYFPDKESLYFAVIFDGLEDLQHRISSALPAHGEVEGTIHGLILTLVSFFKQNRFFFRLMNVEDSKVEGGSNPNRRRWQQERNQLIDAVAQMLERARDTDTLAVVYPRIDAQILLGMVRSVLRHNEEGLTIQQMSDEIARIYLHGMRRK
ncbi:MAG: TetR/AcrR family transcriptional regulator [Candidatus Latescibacteria bacterium]|nr:TetR/AcrR family transcriptional regulator [Candidatus Latescibacterota bacterium]